MFVSKVWWDRHWCWGSDRPTDGARVDVVFGPLVYLSLSISLSLSLMMYLYDEYAGDLDIWVYVCIWSSVLALVGWGLLVHLSVLTSTGAGGGVPWWLHLTSLLHRCCHPSHLIWVYTVINQRHPGTSARARLQHSFGLRYRLLIEDLVLSPLPP